MATRRELQVAVEEAVARGDDWFFVLVEGPPDAARQHMLGPRFGPKGWVVGHKPPQNILRMNARLVQDYLDELPVDELGWDEWAGCDVATPEEIQAYVKYQA